MASVMFRDLFIHGWESFRQEARKQNSAFKDLMFATDKNVLITLVYNSKHKRFTKNPFEGMTELQQYRESRYGKDFFTSELCKKVPIVFWQLDKTKAENRRVYRTIEISRHAVFQFKMPYNIVIYSNKKFRRLYEYSDESELKSGFRTVLDTYAKLALQMQIADPDAMNQLTVMKQILIHSTNLTNRFVKSLANGTYFVNKEFDNMRRRSNDSVLIVLVYDSGVENPLKNGLDQWKESQTSRDFHNKPICRLNPPQFLQVDLRDKKTGLLIEKQKWSFQQPYNFIVYADGFHIETYEAEEDLEDLEQTFSVVKSVYEKLALQQCMFKLGVQHNHFESSQVPISRSFKYYSARDECYLDGEDNMGKSMKNKSMNLMANSNYHKNAHRLSIRDSDLKFISSITTFNATKTAYFTIKFKVQNHNQYINGLTVRKLVMEEFNTGGTLVFVTRSINTKDEIYEVQLVNAAHDDADADMASLTLDQDIEFSRPVMYFTMHFVLFDQLNHPKEGILKRIIQMVENKRREHHHNAHFFREKEINVNECQFHIDLDCGQVYNEDEDHEKHRKTMTLTHRRNSSMGGAPEGRRSSSNGRGSTVNSQPARRTTMQSGQDALAAIYAGAFNADQSPMQKWLDCTPTNYTEVESCLELAKLMTSGQHNDKIVYVFYFTGKNHVAWGHLMRVAAYIKGRAAQYENSPCHFVMVNLLEDKDNHDKLNTSERYYNGVCHHADKHKKIQSLTYREPMFNMKKGWLEFDREYVDILPKVDDVQIILDEYKLKFDQ